MSKMTENHSKFLPFVKPNLKAYKYQKLLIITPMKIRSKGLKFPAIFKKTKFPRKIPKEYLVPTYNNISKTPIPYAIKQYNYSIPKDFIKFTMNKVQLKPLVKNLTASYILDTKELDENESKLSNFSMRKKMIMSDFY